MTYLEQNCRNLLNFADNLYFTILPRTNTTLVIPKLETYKWSRIYQ